MRRRSFLFYLGFTMVLAGIVLTASGTTAFTTLDGDRTTNISVAGDSNAYLTVVGTNAGTTPNFGNSLNTDMTVTLNSNGNGAEFDVDDNGNFQNPPVTFSLASGQNRDVDINADEQNITVDISSILASGGSIELTRIFEIPQASQVVLTPNVVSSGNSGKYEFELENNGSVNVTLDGIGINQTTEPTAVQVGGRNNDNILTAGGTQVMTSIIPIDSDNPGTANIQSFDLQTVDINVGETVTFEFDRFRQGGPGNPGNAPMNGESVEITVTFVDGSQRTLLLDPNG